MQWQEKKQESFLKLVGTTRNLHFVVRFSIWFFVYTFISIFYSTIQLVSWQNNKMWMLGHCRMLNHTKIHTLLEVLHDQSRCRMRHNRTGIRISLSHLSILYSVHLFTFHVIQFLHILTFLCRETQKGDFFVPAYTKKLPNLCPLYTSSKHLTALSSHTNDCWILKARYSTLFCYWQGSNYWEFWNG